MALVCVNSRTMNVRQNLIMHEAECISRFTPGSHVTHVTLKVKSNTHMYVVQKLLPVTQSAIL